jgi:hypothetical protein
VSLTRVLFKVDAVNDASPLHRKLTRALQLMCDLEHNVTQFNIACRSLLNQLAQCGQTWHAQIIQMNSLKWQPNGQASSIGNSNNLFSLCSLFSFRFLLKTGGFSVNYMNDLDEVDNLHQEGVQGS